MEESCGVQVAKMYSCTVISYLGSYLTGYDAPIRNYKTQVLDNQDVLIVLASSKIYGTFQMGI